MLIEEARIRDLSFQAYTDRQVYEISPARIRERAMIVRPAGSFRYQEGKWHPQEYPGFAVVSMVDSNPMNDFLPVWLADIQKELRESLNLDGAYYPLPATSFHQTIANTLSAERFKKSIQKAGLEFAYPGMVGRAFANVPALTDGEPIRMKLIGLSIFGTAMGVLGVFEKEADYHRILHFRSHFYQDSQLAALDVKMTRPFIGHISVAYIEQNLDEAQREQLASVVNRINSTISRSTSYFRLSNTELRRYSTLSEFKKEDHYPVYSW